MQYRLLDCLVNSQLVPDHPLVPAHRLSQFSVAKVLLYDLRIVFAQFLLQDCCGCSHKTGIIAQRRRKEG